MAGTEVRTLEGRLGIPHARLEMAGSPIPQDDAGDHGMGSSGRPALCGDDRASWAAGGATAGSNPPRLAVPATL